MPVREMRGGREDKRPCDQMSLALKLTRFVVSGMAT